MGQFWVLLVKIGVVVGLCTACYAGGNPEDALSYPPSAPPPVEEQVAPLPQVPSFTGPADWVYKASDWVLNLYITQRGTRSQGSHGVLLFEGEEVAGKPDEVRALPIGTVHYQGPAEARAHLWDDSGWQMKDPLVKPVVRNASKPGPRQTADPKGLEKDLKKAVSQ